MSNIYFLFFLNFVFIFLNINNLLSFNTDNRCTKLLYNLNMNLELLKNSIVKKINHIINNINDVKDKDKSLTDEDISLLSNITDILKDINNRFVSINFKLGINHVAISNDFQDINDILMSLLDQLRYYDKFNSISSDLKNVYNEISNSINDIALKNDIAFNGLKYLYQKNSNSLIEDDTFDISLENRAPFKINFSENNIKVDKKSGYDIGIPLVGSYGNEYNFLKRLALIVHDPKNAIKYINSSPYNLENLVKSLYSIDHLKDKLENYIKDPSRSDIDINISSIILGSYIYQNDNSNNIYNLVYHLWAGINNISKDQINPFEKNIDIGIFNSNGIESVKNNSYVPLNRLQNFVVSYHPIQNSETYAISPNNAHIKTSSKISKFIAVAYYMDNNKLHLSITDFLIINDHDAENYLVDRLKDIENIDTLINVLRDMYTYLESKHIGFTSLNSISAWANNLKNMVIGCFE